MSDFLSGFWGVYISIVSIVSILACAVFLWQQSRQRVSSKIGTDTTGHVWDETLAEYNNPLPKWWMWLFYITVVFALIYLALYPGLGTYQGAFNWSQTGQYESEMKQAAAQYGPLYERFAKMDLKEVAGDAQARQMGQRLYLNTCAQCHAEDARGRRGFPNLTDADWIYGGSPEAIKASIAQGRNGVMPPMATAIGSESDVRNVAEYVLSLSGSPHDPLKAQLGREKFAACAACHGADGKGNPQVGAPNLTDKIWLHGSGVDAIVNAINKGFNNQMPAHADFLGDAKVHLLAAYVWGLANASAAPGTPK